MLRIGQLEELQALLLQAPALVERQERRDPDFPAAVKAWLSALETALQNNGLAAAGLVAASRSTLISAERGVVPAGVVLRGQPTSRRLREAAAAQQVRQTGDLVESTVQRDRDRIAAAEGTTRQLLAVARAKGLILGSLDGAPPAEVLAAAWAAIAQDSDLMGAAVNVEGLVGPQDALILFDRALAADLPAGWTFVAPQHQLPG